jgi:hypothetical protein
MSPLKTLVYILNIPIFFLLLFGLAFILIVGGSLLEYSHADCSGAITYIFASFILVPWGFVALIVSLISAIKKRTSWLWLLISIFIGSVAPLLAWLSCYFADRS